MSLVPLDFTNGTRRQMNKKILSLVLAIWLLLQSLFAPIGFVMAQESGDPSASPVAVVEASSVPVPTPTPSVVPSPSPMPSTDPVVTPSITPTPSPTIPPYSSKEYDAYKEEKNKKEAEEEAREDEWKANENNLEWVKAHGGDEDYFVSGKWHANQAAKAAMASPTPTPEVLSIETDPFEEVTTDPFASPSPVPAVCDPLTTDAFSSADVSNQNCLDLDNTSTASGTSGINEITRNDGSVSLTTGTASANGQLENTGNTNVVDTKATSTTTDSESFENEDSPEEFSQSQEATLTVENENTVVANNSMTVEGQSGGNIIEENDGNVQLTTGDIELIANMLNILNLNVTGDDFLHLIVNIFGTLNGTLDLDDIAVALGYEDDDQIEVLAQSKATEVKNTNNAVVNNELNVSGVSGQNQVVGNDGEVDIVTGRIQILANVLNFINTNLTGSKWRFIMVNVFGNLNGDIVVPGTEQFTASDSTYESTGSIDQTEVSNTNNVELVNDVNSNGVSGNNEQIANDDDGHTATSGLTNVQNQILNYLNFNITGDNWVFLIVNVFGKWMGQIVGFGENGTMEAPIEGSFAALSTGSGESTTPSENTASTSVTNQNSAKVTNDINVEGISGGNIVNENDGKTSILTGWVEIDTNLLNIINTNITGRSWMVVFLNVFGDFMGNLFFGNQAKEEYALANNPVESVNQVSSNNSNPSSQNSSHSQSSNTTNQNSNVDNSSDVVVSNTSRRTTRSNVLAMSDSSEEEANVYTAVSIDEQQLSDDHSQSKSLIGTLKDFLYNLYTQVVHVVEPVLAYLHNISLLS